MKGWVYVISNRAMPDLIKVGFTLKDPALRAAELNNTGSPHPYTVDYEVLVNEPRDMEQKVHSRLSHCREGKEWFRCTVAQAIYAIQSVAGNNVQIQNFVSADNEAKAEALRRDAAARQSLNIITQKNNKIKELENQKYKVVNKYNYAIANQNIKTSELCTGVVHWIKKAFVGFLMIISLNLFPVIFEKIGVDLFKIKKTGSEVLDVILLFVEIALFWMPAILIFIYADGLDDKKIEASKLEEKRLITLKNNEISELDYKLQQLNDSNNN